ncbi:MAG: hypothetical protein IJ848_01995 [Alphaproteobacteria bacterium]|nr:hypothetical protein [Alphaproteobacteria bacterium]
MIVDVIKTALSIVSIIPGISNIFDKWTKSYSIESVSKAIVSLAKSITGASTANGSFNKLSNNTELQIKLQELILKNESEIELSIINDKQNARLRDMEYVKNNRRNVRADVMVLSAALCMIFCLLIIVYCKNMPGEVLGIISTMAGIFGSCLKDAYSFEFGSSRGSKEKDITVASMLSKIRK